MLRTKIGDSFQRMFLIGRVTLPFSIRKVPSRVRPVNRIVRRSTPRMYQNRVHGMPHLRRRERSRAARRRRIPPATRAAATACPLTRSTSSAPQTSTTLNSLSLEPRRELPGPSLRTGARGSTSPARARFPMPPAWGSAPWTTTSSPTLATSSCGTRSCSQRLRRPHSSLEVEVTFES